MDCKIFVDGPADRDALVRFLAGAAGAAVVRLGFSDDVRGDGLELLVENNDGDAARKALVPDGFLHFDFFVGVYFTVAADRARRVATVTALLVAL